MSRATRLSHEIDALKALAMAASARIEVMKATNIADEADGKEPRFGKGSFVIEAQYLADLASAMCELITDTHSPSSDTYA